MAWEEWEQLKTAAADRSSARMQLNHVPMDPGGSGGQLVSNRRDWAKAGDDVGSLREDISKAFGKLTDGQKGLGKDSGCVTAAAQKEVHDSWETGNLRQERQRALREALGVAGEGGQRTAEDR
ncbi:hypothetical protein [Streptomyces sp. Agncl-13]|uniref:hypothetical protein n=1 Tax=Streptomyces sp. Agncl-13 TaxID=3400628 RepID=UPI003A87F635